MCLVQHSIGRTGWGEGAGLEVEVDALRRPSTEARAARLLADRRQRTCGLKLEHKSVPLQSWKSAAVSTLIHPCKSSSILSTFYNARAGPQGHHFCEAQC